jgi:pimeloyl-ACP methyl ester carboxylesterase
MDGGTASVRGDGLNFSVQGAGKPAVLVHGLASSLREWDLLAPVLIEAGWRVYACDLLDHGDSPKERDRDCCHLPAVFASLAAWFEGLSLEEPCVLVGHSLGGYLSLQLGLQLGLQLALQRRERLCGLVLIDPVFSPEQISGTVVRSLQMLDIGKKLLHVAPGKMVESVINKTLEPYAPMRVSARRQKTHDLLRASRQVLRLVRGVEDLTPRLGQIDLPALVIWGGRDRLLRPKFFHELVASLPDARGYPMEECGHHPHLEKAEVVNGVIRRFIEELRIR